MQAGRRACRQAGMQAGWASRLATRGAAGAWAPCTPGRHACWHGGVVGEGAGGGPPQHPPHIKQDGQLASLLLGERVGGWVGGGEVGWVGERVWGGEIMGVRGGG